MTDLKFYVLNILYTAFSVLGYLLSFRFGVDDYLHYTKNSKSFIRKHKKGFLNFWTYREIHKEINMGYVYYLNLALLILSPLCFVVSISLGWARVMQIPIAVLNSLLCCVWVPSAIFAHIYDNLQEHGQPLILLRSRRRLRGLDSSILTLLGLVMLVALNVYSYVLAFS